MQRTVKMHATTVSVAAFLVLLLFGFTVQAQNRNNGWQQQQQQINQQRQDQMRQQQDRQRQEMQAQQRHQMQEQMRRQQQDQMRQQMQAQQRQQMQQQQQTQQRQQTADQQRRQLQLQGKLGSDGKPTGMTVSGNVAKLARPLTPAEIQRGFTGKTTSDGKALVRYQGRILTVPASRVSGLSSKLAKPRPHELGAAKSPNNDHSRRILQIATGEKIAGTADKDKIAQDRSSSANRYRLLSSTSPLGLSARLESAKALRLQSHGALDYSVGAMRNSLANRNDKSEKKVDLPEGGVDKKWINSDGSLKWPPNGGFGSVVTREEPLTKGQLIDRYGDADSHGKDHGNYFAPKGTPFEQRSLPPHYKSKPLAVYEVIKELPVTSGTSYPWFDQVGGGRQYKVNRSVSELEDLGYIRRIQ